MRVAASADERPDSTLRPPRAVAASRSAIAVLAGAGLASSYERARPPAEIVREALRRGIDAVHEFPFTRPGAPSRLEGRDEIVN
jgi:hypothetical protein